MALEFVGGGALVTVDVRAVLTETLAAHQWRGNTLGCGCGWNWPEELTYFCGEEERIAKAHAGHVADVLLALSGVQVTKPALEEISEPAAQQFQRLPFSMRMRLAADLMDTVNRRHRREYPTWGISANEPISASSMRFLADHWQQADAAAVLAEGETR